MIQPETTVQTQPQVKELLLNKMVLEGMRENPAIVIIGKRGCGKTVICRDIAIALNNAKKFDECIIFSSDQYYTGGRFENAKVYSEFSPEALQNILDFQSIRSQHARIMSGNGDGTKCPKLFIIFDDCLYDTVSITCAPFVQLMTSHSQNNIGFIVATQHPGVISSAMRECVDYAFLGRNDTINTQKMMYKQYAELFPSFDAFQAVYNQCSTNYECMMLDRKSTSSSIDKLVFWYRAIDQKNKINNPIVFLTREDIYGDHM